MKKTVSKNQNHALKRLGILIGEWKMELSNASFLPSSSDTVIGHVSFEWLEGGAFLVMYMGNKPPATPDAIWLISRDESVQNYAISNMVGGKSLHANTAWELHDNIHG